MKVFIPLLLITFLVANKGCRQEQRVDHLATTTSTSTLQQLLMGNERFAHLKPIHPHETIKQLKDAANGQHPFAAIICCSDSRVAPELVFDEGIGDLFVIRNAGNILGGVEIGSVEYAVEHLGVKLIVIMGHENCGAVKAFIEGGETSGHIKDILDSISKESEIKAIPLNDVDRLDHCVKANVLHGIRQLQTESTIIREKLAKKELFIVGARYDLDDYKVTLIH